MPTPAGHLNGATLLGRSVLCFGLPSRQFVRVRMNRIEARIGRCSMAVRLEHANLTVRDIDGRSEEHTSELQSQSNLVCRLLLEKKKNQPLPTRRMQCGRDSRRVGVITC